MLYPFTELKYINPVVGYGIVAKAFIPKGTITWVQDSLDREFTPQALLHIDENSREVLENYSYRNRKGNYVFCWDNTRYINHSFSPNCMITPYGFEIAVKDIEIGEQLTNDYGCLNIIEPFEPIDEGLARKVVYPDDYLRYFEEWDTLLRSNIRVATTLPQPLKKYLQADVWACLLDIEKNACEIRSILECYYDEAATVV